MARALGWLPFTSNEFTFQWYSSMEENWLDVFWREASTSWQRIAPAGYKIGYRLPATLSIKALLRLGFVKIAHYSNAKSSCAEPHYSYSYAKS